MGPGHVTRGQAAVEWVGAVAVAAILVLGLLAGFDDVAAKATGTVDRVVCALDSAAGGGDGAGCAETDATPAPAGEPAEIEGGLAWSVVDAGSGLRARRFSRGGLAPSERPLVSAPGFGDAPVPAKWCAQQGEQVDPLGGVRRFSICDVGGEIRTCESPSATAVPLCGQALVDPARLNCTTQRECSISGQGGRNRWARCRPATPAPGQPVGWLTCTPIASPTEATERLTRCTAIAPNVARDGTVTRFPELCADASGAAVLCSAGQRVRGACGDIVPDEVTSCGPLTRDRRALCYVDDGTKPVACPGRPEEPCRTVRVLECTIALDQSARGCVDRTPAGGAAAPERAAPTCPARPRRALRAYTVHDYLCRYAPGPNPDGRPVQPSQVVTGDRLASLADDVHSRTDFLVAEPAVERLVEHADQLLDAMRCAYGIDGLDGRGRGARIWLGPARGNPDIPVDGVAATGAITGQIRVRRGHESALSHELGHALTVGNGLEIFDNRYTSIPESYALGEGFAAANSFLLNEYWRRGGPPPGSPARDGTRGMVQAEANDYNRAPIGLRATDFLPGQASFSAHERGYVAVQILQDLKDEIRNQRVWAPEGCTGEGSPIARWYGQSLRTLQASGRRNPGFIAWCTALATTAPNWGVAPETVRRRFRARGIPCGDEAQDEQVLLRLPGNCPVARALANPPRGVAGLLVQSGGRCGV